MFGKEESLQFTTRQTNMKTDTITHEGIITQQLTDQAVSTGTTIMAVEYDGGVIVGADSRTTSGAYIVSRVTDKLDRIADRIYCCRSGAAADTLAITDIVSYRLKLFKMEMNAEPTVLAAATIFKDIIYKYRNQLHAGIICAGWDEYNGGQAYSLPLGGMIKREPVVVGGSGSGFIYGYIDSNFRPNMPEQECLNFVKNAVTLAMSRDGSSGGVVRTAIINKDGCRKEVHLPQDLAKFYTG